MIRLAVAFFAGLTLFGLLVPFTGAPVAIGIAAALVGIGALYIHEVRLIEDEAEQ